MVRFQKLQSVVVIFVALVLVSCDDEKSSEGGAPAPACETMQQADADKQTLLKLVQEQGAEQVAAQRQTCAQQQQQDIKQPSQQTSGNKTPKPKPLPPAEGDEVCGDLEVPDGSGGCRQMEFGDATDSSSCHSISGYWYSGSCHASAFECGSGMIDDGTGEACEAFGIAEATNATECHDASGYWYSNDCHENVISCDSANKPDSSGESCVAKEITDWDTYADCVAHDGYWYDEDDVNQTTLSDFQSLSPSCHEVATTNCPVSGSLAFAHKTNGTIVSGTVTATNVSSVNQQLAGVLSTLRCFQSVTWLNLGTNSLTEIDVRANTSLISLYLAFNDLETIDLSKNVNLQGIDIQGNIFASQPEMSHLTELRTLSIGGNALTSLDVSANSNLETLYANGNWNLTSINVSGLLNLDTLVAYSCDLSSIDVSDNLLLRHLEVDGNDISAIDLSANANLEILWLSGNPMSSFDLTNNTGIQYLYLTGMYNVSGVLDLSHLVNLVDITMQASSWSGFDLSGSASLSSALISHMSQLATLDFDKFHPGFLDMVAGETEYNSGIQIESAKWDAAIGSAPSWTGVQAAGTGINRYFPE